MKPPDFVIGPKNDPYLLRWYVIPRNRLCNIYLHKFLRSGDDRALHDHPWWFVSILLKGTYREVTVENKLCKVTTEWRKRFSIAFHSAEYRHRVELQNNAPCWTLVITGRRVRDWGFWCPQGFVSYKIFTSSTEEGNEIGRGCE